MKIKRTQIMKIKKKCSNDKKNKLNMEIMESWREKKKIEKYNKNNLKINI